MAALMRCARFCTPAIQIPKLLQLAYVRSQQPTCGALYQSLRTVDQRLWNSTAASTALSSEPATNSKVDNLLFTAERYIRQFGRISRKQLDPIVSSMDKEGSISARNSLTLLRLYGSFLFDEPPASRLKLAEELWGKFKELGIPLDVTHYNTLLGVYTQNGQKFSPTEFLASMEANGIQPNRVTYQRLIAQFCEEGNIPGATQVLEHMKASSLPISDQVFNSFITGHLRAKDPESAKNILDAIRQAGLEPTSDTYLALAVGSAEMGQIEEVKKYINEAEIENVPLKSGQMLEVYAALAKAGHSQHLKDIILFLHNGMQFNQDAIRTCSHLIMAGLDDAAYQLFLEMPKPSRVETDQASHGRFFLRALAKHERPVEKVAAIVQGMQEKQINKDDLSAVAQLAYLENKPLYAVSLLEKMRSQSLPVRAHYFWPAFCQLRDEKNRDAIYEMVGKMATLTDTRDDFVHTLHSYIVPALLEVGETPEDIVSKLQTLGYEEKEVNFAYFVHLLETEDAKAAADFLEGHDVNIVFGALRTALASLVSRTDDYRLIFKILAKLRAQSSVWQGLAYDLTTAALKRALTIESRSNWSNGQQIFDFMVEKKLMISERHVKELSASMAGAPTELIERLKDVVSEDTAAATEREAPEVFATDLTLQELKKMSDTNPSNKALQKRLLIKACAVGDIQEAEKVVAQLEAEGFVFPPIVLAQLAYLYATFAKDISKARSYMDQLQSKFPEHRNYLIAALKLAALQAGHGKVDDAVKTLEKYADKHKDVVQKQDFRREDYFADVVKAAQDVESAKRLRDCLVNSGYLRAENAQLLDSYMEKVIESRDPDRILQETEHIIKTHRCSPSIDGVLKFFIEKEDPERLQKVVDLLAELHGLMNVYHHLIADFIECGHIKRARKILETPGLRANMQRLNYYCQNFIERNKIKELEILVEVTRDLFGVDRDNMLFHLIRGYVSQNNLQLALDVLLRYEEEMLQPSARTLRFLARSLEREGKPVPFEVPEFEPPASLPKARQAKQAKPETKQETTPTQKQETRQSQVQAPKTQETQTQQASAKVAASAEVLKLKTHIEEEAVDKVMATLKSGEKGLLSQAISQMKRPWPQAGLRTLFGALGKAGDLETLKSIQERSLPYSLKSSLRASILSAAVASGKPTEAIELMEAAPGDNAKYLTLPTLIALQEKSPELLDRVENWARKMTEKKYLEPIAKMWALHYNSSSPKAKQLLQEFPDLAKFASVTELCAKAAEQNEVGVMEDLLKLKKEVDNKQGVAVAYSFLLVLHTNQNNVEGVQKTCERVIEDGLTRADLRRAFVTQAEELLTQKGKPLPAWPDASSSSSDSSSSDEEKR